MRGENGDKLQSKINEFHDFWEMGEGGKLSDSPRTTQ